MPTDFTRLVSSRHSVRDFTSAPVSAELLNEVLADARHNPSWSNTRPYALAVATGEQLARIKRSYLEAFDASLDLQHRKRGAWAKALFTRRGLPTGDFRTWGKYPADLQERSKKVGKGLYGLMGVPRGDQAARDAAQRRNCELFGAPVGVFLFARAELLPFSAHDAGLMLQTLILAAHAKGLSTCPIGLLATWRHPVADEFEVPKKFKLLTGLALGYASDAAVNQFAAEHPAIQLLSQKNVQV